MLAEDKKEKEYFQGPAKISNQLSLLQQEESSRGFRQEDSIKNIEKIDLEKVEQYADSRKKIHLSQIFTPIALGTQKQIQQKANHKSIKKLPRFQVRSSKHSLTFLQLTKVTNMTREFFKMLKAKAGIGVGQNLDEYQKSLVEGSLSAEEKQRGKKKILRRINTCFLKYSLCNLRLFSQQNLSILLWNCLQTLIILIIFIWLPVKFSFGYNVIAIGSQNLQIESILISLMMLDIPIKLNTTYMEQGNEIEDRFLIIKNYLKKSALVDVASLLLIFSQSYQQDISLLQIVLIVIFIIAKSKKLNRTINQLLEQTYFNLNSAVMEIIFIMKLVSTISLISHSFACIYHGIAHYYPIPEKTWIYVNHLEHESNLTKYNYSFYWAIQTMSTVGYGDLTPNNDWEVLFATVTMFFACAIFAFSLNSIGVFVQALYSQEQDYKQV